MAVKSEGEMDTLLSSFDKIYQDFKLAMEEIKLLKASLDAEVKKREALETSSVALKQENERLMKLYTNCINNMTDKLEYRAKFRKLEEQMHAVRDENQTKENEHMKAVELMKQEYSAMIGDLEAKIRRFQLEKASDEAIINQLHQDLTAHKSHIQALASRLEQLHNNLDSKYNLEIQDLKDCLLLEQEEKKELSKKLQDLEKELLISRTKLAQEQQNVASNQQVETFKLKIMKLRRENEVLKRKIQGSKEG